MPDKAEEITTTCSVIPLRVLESMRIDPATLGQGLRELVSYELETAETDLSGDVGDTHIQTETESSHPS